MDHLKLSGVLCMPSTEKPISFNREVKVEERMASATGHCLAFVTVPTIEVARKIAGNLVTQRLAACVNIIPQLESIYVWEGKVESSQELLLKIKTRREMMDKLVESVKENHPYQVCEVISVPIEAGNPDYLRWIDESVGSGQGNAA